MAFLSGYAGWNMGLTAEELDQAATTLLTQYNDTRILTVSTAGGQGTVIDTPSAYNRVKDTVVRLKALPSGACAFSHWSGDVPAGMATANPLVVSMSANLALTANFISGPVSVSLTRAPSGEALIRFPAQVGVPYTVDYRDDLAAGCWETLANVLKPLTSEVVIISDPVVQPRRFFRITTPAP